MHLHDVDLIPMQWVQTNDTNTVRITNTRFQDLESQYSQLEDPDYHMYKTWLYKIINHRGASEDWVKLCVFQIKALKALISLMEKGRLTIAVPIKQHKMGLILIEALQYIVSNDIKL